MPGHLVWPAFWGKNAISGMFCDWRRWYWLMKGWESNIIYALSYIKNRVAHDDNYFNAENENSSILIKCFIVKYWAYVTWSKKQK